MNRQMTTTRARSPVARLACRLLATGVLLWPLSAAAQAVHDPNSGVTVDLSVLGDHSPSGGGVGYATINPRARDGRIAMPGPIPPRSRLHVAPLAGGTTTARATPSTPLRSRLEQPMTARATTPPPRPATARPPARAPRQPEPAIARPEPVVAPPKPTTETASRGDVPLPAPAANAPPPMPIAPRVPTPAAPAADPPAPAMPTAPQPAAISPPPPAPAQPPPEPVKASPAPPSQVASAPPATAPVDTSPDRLSVLFEGEESRLGADARTSLKAIADQLGTEQSSRLQLLAYAGGEGLSPSRARRVSLSRALAVRAFLMKNGVSSSRIDVRALGDKVDGQPLNRVDVLPVAR